MVAKPKIITKPHIEMQICSLVRYMPSADTGYVYVFVEEYVTCHTCKSPETILQRDTRLFFLQCETCGSRCSVASIKSGFQAVTGKRAAIRAKTT